MNRSSSAAVLQAGDTETLYRRAGDGPPVLVLCAGALADPRGGRLFEALARRFRVVAIAVSAGDVPADTLSGWLAEVIEGLGLVRPTVVVDRALAGALLDGLVAAGVVAGVIAVAADGGEDAIAAAIAARVEGGRPRD